MFIHRKLHIELPKLESCTAENGTRFYITPEGNHYPSVTTALAVRNKAAIDEWKKRVGNKEADRIGKLASDNGNLIHKLSETYLYNRPIDEDVLMPLPKMMFHNFKPLLNKINNIVALETSLYSDQLQLAGTVDCIATYENIPSIIDFKNAMKPKRKEWITNYFLQCTAYSEMFKERIGIDIKQCVILITNMEGTVQEFIIRKDNYIDILHNTIEQYRSLNATA